MRDSAANMEMQLREANDFSGRIRQRSTEAQWIHVEYPLKIRIIHLEITISMDFDLEFNAFDLDNPNHCILELWLSSLSIVTHTWKHIRGLIMLTSIWLHW